MAVLTDVTYYYIACFSGIFLASKILLVKFILKRVTRPKIKIILIVLVILFSPISFPIFGLFELLRPGSAWLAWAALCAYGLDFALIQWVRVIFEPLKALDDIQDDPTLTGA